MSLPGNLENLIAIEEARRPRPDLPPEKSRSNPSSERPTP
jgi:hypothetical protein